MAFPRKEKAHELRTITIYFLALNVARTLGFYTDVRMGRNATDLTRQFKKHAGPEMEEKGKRMSEITEQLRQEVIAENIKPDHLASSELFRRQTIHPELIELHKREKEILEKEVDFTFERYTIRKEYYERVDENGRELFSSTFPAEVKVEFMGVPVTLDPYKAFMYLEANGYIILEEDFEREQQDAKARADAQASKVAANVVRSTP